MAITRCRLKDMICLAVCQGAMVAQQLSIHTIVLQPALLFPLQEVSPVKAGEAPAGASVAVKACYWSDARPSGSLLMKTATVQDEAAIGAEEAHQLRLTTIFWRPANLNLARLRASLACRAFHRCLSAHYHQACMSGRIHLCYAQQQALLC